MTAKIWSSWVSTIGIWMDGHVSFQTANSKDVVLKTISIYTHDNERDNNDQK